MNLMPRHASLAATLCRRTLGSYFGSTSSQKYKNVRLMSTSVDGTSSSQKKSVCPSTGTPLLTPAGLLFEYETIMNPSTFASDNDPSEGELDVCLLPKDEDNLTEHVKPPESEFFFIPQVKLHDGDGSQRKRVLVLCTGGTLTMAPNPEQGGALSRVPGK